MAISSKRVEEVKYILSAAELQQLGEDLARTARESIRNENDRKSAMANFKAMSEASSSRISALSLSITQGYEMRDMECVVYFGLPRPGFKQVVRPDTNEIVREEPMTAEEMQTAFDFETGKKPQ